MPGVLVKVKLAQQQEFVIDGYTQPEGSRKYFGALLVGYQGTDGILFAGRIGTGFSEKVLEHLYDDLIVDGCLGRKEYFPDWRKFRER